MSLEKIHLVTKPFTQFNYRGKYETSFHIKSVDVFYTSAVPPRGVFPTPDKFTMNLERQNNDIRMLGVKRASYHFIFMVVILLCMNSEPFSPSLAQLQPLLSLMLPSVGLSSPFPAPRFQGFTLLHPSTVLRGFPLQASWHSVGLCGPAFMMTE